MPGKRILLMHNRAPGDILVLTALVRDIALTYPGKFDICVKTSAMDFWANNPYIQQRPPSEHGSMDHFTICYGKGINHTHEYETVHFLAYFHRAFNEKYNTDVRVHFPYPDVHLSPAEDTPVIEGRYWVLLSGGKSDFPAKVWRTDYFQKLVDLAAPHGIKFVQCGSADSGHWHPALQGTLDLVGRTNLRDMIRLVKYADGVVCGLTMSMHLAAAMQRPCVVLSGGREAWWWEAYVRENRGLVCPEKIKIPHRFLHTIGLLDCCKHHGCWKKKVSLSDKGWSFCTRPIATGGVPVSECLNMITPEHALTALLSYYLDGTLTPLPEMRQKLVG